jgi:hypothetical protein
LVPTGLVRQPTGRPARAVSLSIGSSVSDERNSAVAGFYQRALRSISPVSASRRSPMKPRPSSPQGEKAVSERTPKGV